MPFTTGKALTRLTALAWSVITGTPTTVAGYGITDAVTLTGAQTLTNKSIVATQLTGTLQAAQMPALTGDVTTVAGALAATIAAGAVTLSKMANLTASTILGNNTGSAATPIALAPAQVKALLAITNADVSGLGSLATLSSVNLSTLATGTLQAAQEPAHTGDVTNAAGSLALALATVNANIGAFGSATQVAQVTANAKGLTTAVANVAIAIPATAISDSTAAGRAMVTAATATAQTALLDTVTSALKGVAPPSGGGTANFLRADLSWSAPPSSAPVSGAATATLTAAVFEWTETLTATGVISTNRITVAIADHTDTDENAAEMLSLDAMSASAGTGQITVTMAFRDPTSGPIKLNWSAA